MITQNSPNFCQRSARYFEKCRSKSVIAVVYNPYNSNGAVIAPFADIKSCLNLYMQVLCRARILRRSTVRCKKKCQFRLGQVKLCYVRLGQISQVSFGQLRIGSFFSYGKLPYGEKSQSCIEYRRYTPRTSHSESSVG